MPLTKSHTIVRLFFLSIVCFLTVFSTQMTILYIHGYGSTGNATKGQLLRRMMPDHRVISPTFDYDNSTPWQIQEQIRMAVESEKVKMIVGSSFGGYHTICSTVFFHGIVWAINPVHDVEATIRRVILNQEAANGNVPNKAAQSFLEIYRDFNEKVFLHRAAINQQGLWPHETPLNFALSSDDELLGDHNPLLNLFPTHNSVIWKDHCGHRFFRFEELKSELHSCL